MAQGKFELIKVIIDGISPYFTTGTFNYTDPQEVGDGDDIRLTNNDYITGKSVKNGMLTLSLGGVDGNIILVKQLKRKNLYNNIVCIAKNASNEEVRFEFRNVTRKTALGNAIGNGDPVNTDIEFAYGEDALVS